MNERQNGRLQIAADTEHIQPDPIAVAYDKLKAALAAGRDDLDARDTLQVDKLNEGPPPEPIYLNFIEGRFAGVEKPASQTMAPNNGKSTQTNAKTRNRRKRTDGKQT